TALAVVVGTGLAAVTAGRWAGYRYGRDAAERLAGTAAAYLSLVTAAPRAGTTAGYDLSQLLIQSRAMDRLPGWAGNLEVFHGTAPLVSATGQPLPPAILEDLRRREAVIWTENGALVPMR